MLRRRARVWGALVAVTALLAVSVGSATPAAAQVDLDPYQGLGTWVDVFDYAPRLQAEGALPHVTAESTDDMASLGVRTLYLQIANPDDAPSTELVDATTLKAIIRRAHENDLLVVAWFLPYVTDLDKDDQFIRAIAALRVDGRSVDAIALDIEDTQAVPDLAARNNRVVELARRARAVMDDDMALGAIVYPAVQLEVINPVLWPAFPYRRLGASIDVWMPMSYFTFRDEASGYRDAYAYSAESVSRLRKRLGRNAPVHLVGGIADAMTPADYEAFLRAARRTKSIGYSLYDYATTLSPAWSHLRGGSSSQS